MGVKSKEIDAYIARAPEFARPILVRIRAAFHAGCPPLVERIKWGSPSFEHLGILGGMAAFQKHVGFGFWKARLMDDPHGLFEGGPRASAMIARAGSVADLPARSVLVGYVRQARRLNEDGVKAPASARPKERRRVVVPADLRAAMRDRSKARKTFEGLPPGARRDYIDWIEEARRPATRARRLATAIEWLEEGKRRNWKYERRKGVKSLPGGQTQDGRPEET